MEIITMDQKEYNLIWDKIYKTFEFHPSCDKDVIPFKFEQTHKIYKLKKYWSKEQELIINDVMEKLCKHEMYALDWQHDCFIYCPKEEIPFDYSFYDKERDCNVYFPSYYPNGDYYFFISTDWSFGMLGHPWRQEIYIWGEGLLNEFEKLKEALSLDEIYNKSEV